VARWVYEIGSISAKTAEEASDSHERSLNTNIAQAIGLVMNTDSISQTRSDGNYNLLSKDSHSGTTITKANTSIQGVAGSSVTSIAIENDDCSLNNLKIDELEITSAVVGTRVSDCDIKKVIFYPNMKSSNTIFSNCIIEEIEFGLGTEQYTLGLLNKDYSDVLNTIFRACRFKQDKSIILPLTAEIVFDCCIFDVDIWIGQSASTTFTNCFFNSNIEFVVNPPTSIAPLVIGMPGGQVLITQSHFTNDAFINHPALGNLVDVQAAGCYVEALFPFLNTTIHWEIIT